jgi:drug/metabolite transporter (DMT)-like permease
MMSNTTAGIIYGLASGALWGLIFIAPRAAEPYSEVDLAVWRYIAFGMTSLLLMAAHKRFRPHNISKHHLVTALMLGVIGYVFYYICIAFSIRLAGPALTPLIIGSLPLTLAIYGNWRDQNVAWKRLIFPLALIVVGLTCVYTATLNHSVEQRPANAVLWGCLFALAAHVSWFTYAVINSNVMLSKDAPSALGWTSLQGVGAMVGVVPLLILAPMLGWSRIADLGLWHMDGARFIFWAVLVGVVASWGGQHLWTLASNRLPLALSGQLIVSETVFGLIFGFMWSQRWPNLLEFFGAVFLIIGVLGGVWVFRKSSPRVATQSEHDNAT